MEFDLTKCNKILDEFEILVNEGKCNDYEGPLKIGVDLGTANIVLAAVDMNNNPVAGVTCRSSLVKDGIVVDYIGAIKVVKELKIKLEKIVNTELTTAATAIPPGILGGNIKVISNVVSGAGFYVNNVIDEPTAAATVIQCTDGAVVDVGGGTTGVSILKDGEVIFTGDEPTGGTHMTLTLAGYYGMTIEDGEEYKLDKANEDDVFHIVEPVVEKMAAIIKNYVKDYDVNNIYVVGGACCFEKFQTVFEQYIGIKTVKPSVPLLVTPLGIAMNSKIDCY
ncbi:MAG: ethanolamine utilization protein EutJ [Peptostreptococcaceae bacterium]|nr:ethanolamine utilization protein EutJ [Peptostreptococcaceae bacterium]